jgi:hypothetical protein
MQTSRFRIFVVLLYVVCSLAGACAGYFYYFPHPLFITENLIFADLRYAGAIVGAAIGAAAASLLRGRSSRIPSGSSGVWLVFPIVLCCGGLIYVLLSENRSSGIITLLLLCAPWIAVVVQQGFKNRNAAL